jgi:hypothetical protein
MRTARGIHRGKVPSLVTKSTAACNGKRLDVGCCIVSEFKGGRVVDGKEHYDDLYALDEFSR